MVPEHEAVVATKAGPVPSHRWCHHDGGANGPRSEQQEDHDLCSRTGSERKQRRYRGGGSSTAPEGAREGPDSLFTVDRREPFTEEL
jgi:hypothetical protein